MSISEPKMSYKCIFGTVLNHLDGSFWNHFQPQNGPEIRHKLPNGDPKGVNMHFSDCLDHFGCKVSAFLAKT